MTGMGQVYCFTMRQMLKGRANLIATLLLLLFSAAAPPVSTLLMGGTETEASAITTVYVQNDTDYELMFADIPEINPIFADTVFTDTDLTEVTYGEKITSSEAYVHITHNTAENFFEVAGFMREDADFSHQELDACSGVLSKLLDEARFLRQNAAPEQMNILMSDYNVEVQDINEYQNGGEEDYDIRFGVQMAYCILVLMLCTFVSSYIVQIIVQEKASKLSEFLMVNVRPLALLLGKILAMMTYVFGMLIVYGLTYVASVWITGKFADTSVLMNPFAEMGFSLDALHLSLSAGIVAVISLLMGYLMISLFAGLTGAGCSTTEDVEPANLTVMMTVLVGYIASISLAGTDIPAVAAISSLVPVLSMFTVPVRYILGDIGIGMVLASWGIQLLAILLLAYMSAKIYRDLLLYRGRRLKVGGYISMLRQDGGVSMLCQDGDASPGQKEDGSAPRQNGKEMHR